MGEGLKHDADRLKGTVGTRAKEEAENRKGQAVHVAGSASTALNTAAEDLRGNPDVPDWMESALQQTARKIENLANHVDGRSIDQLGRDASDFGRRRLCRRTRAARRGRQETARSGWRPGCNIPIWKRLRLTRRRERQANQRSRLYLSLWH